MREAKVGIGDVVVHRFRPFRGVIFDVDPLFNHTDEWWESIPIEVRPRKDQPFVALNTSAIAAELLESELFGHEAGAFTGAVKTHVGHFERADGGTLILDELATISLRMQEKILRVIEYGEIQRVGGSETLQVDVRIVGSTNADLRQLAAAGTFRQALLDRLAFDVITVPPLRERLEDILPLAYAFAINMASELKRELFAGFGPRASSSLLQHDWPEVVRAVDALPPEESGKDEWQYWKSIALAEQALSNEYVWDVEAAEDQAVQRRVDRLLAADIAEAVASSVAIATSVCYVCAPLATPILQMHRVHVGMISFGTEEPVPPFRTAPR